jgi:hypothetical protein
MKTQRVATWVAAIEDQPGGLAAKLNALAAAGVNLEFLIARRAPDKPGTGVVFVTPVEGAKQGRAAKAAGFRKAENLHTVRIEGADKPGLGARLTQAFADQGLNLRALSGAAIGKKFVCHVAVDSETDAAKAVRIVRSL